MARGRNQFVATAGQYYLAYALAMRQINTGLTLGNAPSVDLLASSADGRRSMSFQVKTARSAHRPNRYGREGFEWDVGAGVIGRHSPSFWYAFIDLQEGSQDLREGPRGWKPRVFFVPSRWVAEFVKPTFWRFMYFLPVTAQHLTEERWDLVEGYLAEREEAVAWASAWPEDLLCKWGDSP